MLPTHGVSSKNNGLSGIPVINRTVALSIAWVIGSILAIVFGFLNCRSNSYSYLLQCDDKMCTYSSTGTAKVQPIHFLRSDILNVEVSRISMDGDIISPEDFKKGQRFGYSLSLHFKHSAVPNSRIKTEKIITFTPHDMGKRTAKAAEKKMIEYKSKNKNKLNLENSKYVTAIGILAVFFGLLSLIMAFALGQWSDPTPKRLKKAA